MYLPTMDQDLDTMLAALPWSKALRRSSAFVDIGSGKGRVVFLAAMRAFREVVGVELSPVLHEVAERNHEIMRRTGTLQSPVRLVHEDATTFVQPESPVLAYMYHPFRESIAREVVGRLVASVRRKPRPAAILYCHPTLQDCIRPEAFTDGGMFAQSAEGQRQTRRFVLGWTLYTNELWLQGCSASL
jgi:SAM-dependent methyltransferase